MFVSPKIAENRAAGGGRGTGYELVVWARVRRTHTVKNRRIAKKALPAADLQGSAGPSRVTQTHRSTNRKIKLHRLYPLTQSLRGGGGNEAMLEAAHSALLPIFL